MTAISSHECVNCTGMLHHPAHIRSLYRPQPYRQREAQALQRLGTMSQLSDGCASFIFIPPTFAIHKYLCSKNLELQKFVENAQKQKMRILVKKSSLITIHSITTANIHKYQGNLEVRSKRTELNTTKYWIIAHSGEIIFMLNSQIVLGNHSVVICSTGDCSSFCL